MNETITTFDLMMTNVCPACPIYMTTCKHIGIVGEACFMLGMLLEVKNETSKK